MATQTQVDVGLKDQARKTVAHKLSTLLADSYILYLKTQNFHWNVTGPNFQSLHLLFEQQYTDLATAVDDIAERIRTLGFPAPGSFNVFLKIGTLSEATDTPSAPEMVQQLLNDHEAVCQHLHDLVKTVTDVNDEASLALVSERLMVHEKTAWMLRSSL